ncbi:hypothetical protein G9U51_12160 [Calidifontibacter sp. DB0510]|uniref:DUF4350 domain-containing protein n=1 Tax=Metallococcus carri TaxID=1656884 RepID=A0A967B2V5_9MICO|nr:DUF4350 domain-containing protein [Metallococcus carri]NHN56533.1 hypothetical protein [Metallococcus carri]NOP38832.1 hypothetical protein [Calidifontibacter sp. DB2511S]
MNRRRAAFWAVVGLLLVGSALLVVLLRGSSGVPLDPRNPEPDGAEAVARVLSEQGVTVISASSRDAVAAAQPDAASTVLVSMPSAVSSERLRQVLRASSGAALVVLIRPGAAQLNTVLGTDTTTTPWSGVSGSACELPSLQGLSPLGVGNAYVGLPSDAQTCFGDPLNGAPVFQLPAVEDRPAVLVIGSVSILSNELIDKGDNAAIALRALGSQPRLVWYSGDFDASAPPPPSPWPLWVSPAVLLLVACILLTMVWRGRRLGRLVTEPLPVVVKADETARARGELYRRSRDTVRAGQILRQASSTRLSAYLGLSPHTDPTQLVDEVARAAGEQPQRVGELLHGPDTTTEPALAKVAQDLETLERQVRRR